MTITFSCAKCGRTLRTTDEKAGRKARCPGCGDILTVPASAAPPEASYEDWDDSSPGAAESEDDEEAVPTPLPARRRSRSCPMCGAGAAASARTCKACGEPLDADQKRGRSGDGVPQSVEVDRVFKDAWAIYKANLSNVVGSFLANRTLLLVACGLVYLLLATLIFGTMTALAGNGPPPQGGPPAAFLAVFLGGLLVIYVGLICVSLVFELAWVRFSLLLVRGKQPEVSDAINGFELALPSALPLFVAGLIMSLGMALLILPGLVLAILLAFLWHVLADQKIRGMEAIAAAFRLGAANFLPLLLLGLLGGLINLAGMLCLGIGVLFSAPFVSLLFAVAYQHAQGKRVAA